MDVNGVQVWIERQIRMQEVTIERAAGDLRRQVAVVRGTYDIVVANHTDDQYAVHASCVDGALGGVCYLVLPPKSYVILPNWTCDKEEGHIEVVVMADHTAMPSFGGDFTAPQPVGVDGLTRVEMKQYPVENWFRFDHESGVRHTIWLHSEK